MVTKKLIFLVFITISLFCVSGCEERILIPGNPEIERELIGVWSLVDADDLMEGDLIIDNRGKGVEYGVYGTDIIEFKHDFSQIEYILERDVLIFCNRTYKRNNTEKKQSSNVLIPNEGLVKLYLIDGALPMVIKVGYKPDWDLFYKKISIWSPQFGYEVDTIWYRVTDDYIYRATVQDSSGRTSITIRSGLGDPKHDLDNLGYQPWHLSYDTTMTSGHYNVVFQGPVIIGSSVGYTNSGDEYYIPLRSYLQRFSGGFQHTGYVVPGLGTVHAEWLNNNINWGVSLREFPIFHHVATMIGYYNPLDGYDAGYNIGGR